MIAPEPCVLLHMWLQSHQTEPRCLAFPWPLSLGWPIRGFLAGAARRVISFDCRSALSLLPLVWPMVPCPAPMPSRQSPCQMMSTSSVGEPRHCYYHFTCLQPRPSAGLRVCQSANGTPLAACCTFGSFAYISGPTSRSHRRPVAGRRLPRAPQ